MRNSVSLTCWHPFSLLPCPPSPLVPSLGVNLHHCFTFFATLDSSRLNNLHEKWLRTGPLPVFLPLSTVLWFLVPRELSNTGQSVSYGGHSGGHWPIFHRLFPLPGSLGSMWAQKKKSFILGRVCIILLPTMFKPRGICKASQGLPWFNFLMETRRDS